MSSGRGKLFAALNRAREELEQEKAETLSVVSAASSSVSILNNRQKFEAQTTFFVYVVHIRRRMDYKDFHEGLVEQGFSDQNY